MSEPDISNIGGGFLCGEEHSLTGEKRSLVRSDGSNGIFGVRRISREVTKSLAVIEPGLFGLIGGVGKVNSGIFVCTIIS